MNKRTRAWVLLLTTGLPTPALWRHPNKSGRTGSAARGATVRVVVRPAARQRVAQLPTGSSSDTRGVSVGWLSDDPDVARWVAAQPPTTPPAPRVRRQTPRKASPAGSEARRGTETPAPPAKPAKASRAASRAAQTAAWPSSWDALAASWDQTRG